MSEQHTPETTRPLTNLKLTMTDDPIDKGLVQIHGQETGYVRNFAFRFTVHREKGEQIINRDDVLQTALRERDEARAMVAELVKALAGIGSKYPVSIKADDGDRWCFCEVRSGNPMMGGRHAKRCDEAAAILAKAATL